MYVSYAKAASRPLFCFVHYHFQHFLVAIYLVTFSMHMPFGTLTMAKGMPQESETLRGRPRDPWDSLLLKVSSPIRSVVRQKHVGTAIVFVIS